MEVVAPSSSAEYPHQPRDADLIPLDELVRQTPGAHPIGSVDESSWPSSPSPAALTLPDWSAGAVVLDTDVASRSFKGRLPATTSARLTGRQPLITFVTIGELPVDEAAPTGPVNRDRLDEWLSDKPVIPGARGIAVTWGELSAARAVRARSMTRGSPPAASPTACRSRR